MQIDGTQIFINYSVSNNGEKVYYYFYLGFFGSLHDFSILLVSLIKVTN